MYEFIQFKIIVLQILIAPFVFYMFFQRPCYVLLDRICKIVPRATVMTLGKTAVCAYAVSFPKFVPFFMFMGLVLFCFGLVRSYGYFIRVALILGALPLRLFR